MRDIGELDIYRSGIYDLLLAAADGRQSVSVTPGIFAYLRCDPFEDLRRRSDRLEPSGALIRNLKLRLIIDRKEIFTNANIEQVRDNTYKNGKILEDDDTKRNDHPTVSHREPQKNA